MNYYIIYFEEPKEKAVVLARTREEAFQLVRFESDNRSAMQIIMTGKADNPAVISLTAID